MTSLENHKNVLFLNASFAFSAKFFRKLNSEIEKFGADLGFPPKKFIGNAKEAFIKQRMLALQVWIFPILEISGK